MSDDPYQWLEDITGRRALAWVRDRNAETVAELTGTDRFAELREAIREVFDSADRIPYVTRRGEYRYNFWRDARHPRGLWRRTTLAEYTTDRPSWQVLLDVDALADDEGENWVWDGAQVLAPDYRRALVWLSRGGADAAVLREYDIESRSFVDDGFGLAEAKSSVDWIDADHVYVATDFGTGTLTNSGYPRTVRRWRRGTPLAEAEPVYEGKPDDIAVMAYHDDTVGFERDFVRRSIDFYRGEVYLLDGDALRRIEVPDDAIVGVHRDWLLVELRGAWSVAGRTFAAGSLLAADFDAFLAGDRELTTLYEPDEHGCLTDYTWTRHHLVVETLHDVTSRVEVHTPSASGWARRPLPGVPELATASVAGTDPDADDEYLLDTDGFLQPSTLCLGHLGHLGQSHAEQGHPEQECPEERPAVAIKRAPSHFDADGMAVEQHFATAEDGTRIPYFTVGARDADADCPTLLYGYGGFEISLVPGYRGDLGRAWLARGGRYVVANIRGGGEYGPRWHAGTLRGNRHLVYSDFAAVARDLLQRGLSTPARLGIQGGSNGGLLMGVMLTRYPDLFGAVVAEVPLTDMLRYHRLLAGASWMAEYGDPDDPAEAGFLRRFSPYHQLRAGRRYPPALLTTSTRDDRVHPGHARKMVARMREYGLPVNYYENIEGGHGGAADNDQAAFLSALAYEFLWHHLT